MSHAFFTKLRFSCTLFNLHEGGGFRFLLWQSLIRTAMAISPASIPRTINSVLNRSTSIIAFDEGEGSLTKLVVCDPVVLAVCEGKP